FADDAGVRSNNLRGFSLSVERRVGAIRSDEDRIGEYLSEVAAVSAETLETQQATRLRPRPQRTPRVFSVRARAAASFGRIVWPPQWRSAAISPVFARRFQNQPAQRSDRK